MKHIINIKRTSLLVFIVCISLINSAYSQNKQTHTPIQVKKQTALKLETEKAWKELNIWKSQFCDSQLECDRYDKSTYLEQRKFEDKLYRKRVRLALNFLESYPDDPRYYEALKIYLHMFFEPLFISEKISDSLTALLSKEYTSSQRQPFLQQHRLLPIDVSERNKWQKKTYELTENFLASNAPLEQKLSVEIGLISRDLRMASELYKHMGVPKKKGFESEFWKQFDKHYWESFRLRQVNLIKKYSELEIMAKHVAGLIAYVKKRAPHLEEFYWESFLQKTSADNSLYHHKGFTAIREMVKVNLKALKNVDETKPLEMTFTAIDGTTIDLAKMRGKVVLIDFWNIGCAPCIKEMPHVQALYDKYRNQGFEVIGLASNNDLDKEQVLKILKKTGATWPQRLDKGKDVIVSYHALYNIKSYPTVWLLNKEGIIVDKKARGVRLEPLIRKHLGLDKD